VGPFFLPIPTADPGPFSLPISTKEFAHRTASPDNDYTYDTLDRVIEADYHDGQDEQFDYDKLGNRESVNMRDGGDVVYEVDSLVNRYERIGWPAGHWKLDDDAANTVVADSSGNENTGTASTDTENLTTDGKVGDGKAFDLDGGSEFVNCGHDGSLSMPGDFTYAVWIRPDAVNSYYPILCRGNSVWRDGFFISWSRLRSYVFYTGDNSRSNSAANTIVVGQWQHVALVHKDKICHMYVNGQEVEYDPGYPAAGTGDKINYYNDDVLISKGQESGQWYFDGKMDDVRIYGRALSDEEVWALYKAKDQEVLSAQDNIEYDEAGNLVRDRKGYEYEYDYENRLIGVTRSSDPVTVAEYAYDALGRRICKIDKIADPDVTTYYYYNNNWQVLTETDDNDYTLRSFIYGNYIDEVLTMIDHTNDDAEYYYAHDHLYSPVALMESDGDVVERYEYDAYGKPYFMDASFNLLATQKSAYGNPYGFTGRRVDIHDNGNLVKQHSRIRDLEYYTGRWFTPDPGGYIEGVNLYECVKSNTLLYLDPMGLESIGDSLDKYISDLRNRWFFEYSRIGEFIDALKQLEKNKTIKVKGRTLGDKIFGRSAAYHYLSNTIRIDNYNDYSGIVHEMVHALDDVKDWYIKILFIEDHEASEALAYGAENLIRRVRSSNFDLVENAKTAEEAEKHWRRSWGQINSIFSAEMDYKKKVTRKVFCPINRCWMYKEISVPMRRTLVSNDIKDIMYKLGIRIKCLKFREIYIDKLEKKGVKCLNLTCDFSKPVITHDEYGEHISTSFILNPVFVGEK